ncbi:DoxX family protein [Chryseolinea sp. T2]|uniref:DoxX family protein n=1 Tax=Chryseolinea sp. T2 TaxID=3129255 RepID=UPI003077FC40
MKKDKIIYWIATGLIAVAMLLSAFMYLSKSEELIKNFAAIGLPLYLVMLLGTAKLIGAILLLAPVAARFKEWTYAGFLFTFAGAIWTHAATATPWIAPLLFLVVLGVSYIYWNKTKSASA